MYIILFKASLGKYFAFKSFIVPYRTRSNHFKILIIFTVKITLLLLRKFIRCPPCKFFHPLSNYFLLKIFLSHAEALILQAS